MPDLSFSVMGVEPASRGLVPLLHFQLKVRNSPASEMVQAVLLNAQIQIQTPQRSYNALEKEKLIELFGTPERWGETLRNKLWTHSHATIGQFAGEASAVLPVQCTYDLNVIATKYFSALEDGEVPLLFLFSGTVFYAAEDGRLQVQQISWNAECTYRMPAGLWRELMDRHFPNSAWVSMHRDVFERLCAFKRRHGLATWDQALDELLARDNGERTVPTLDSRPSALVTSSNEVPA